MRTLEALLKKGIVVLEESGIGEARLDAWLLLEYVTGKSRAYYFAHPDDPVAEEKAETYLELCRQRGNHIPLQHLTHRAFFMQYEFYVNEHVLIPRQDTEVLVEEAQKRLCSIQAPQILDMCTGSGCILLSLLAEKKDAFGTGVDISLDALQVAERNAKSLELCDRALFIKSNLFSGYYFQEKCSKEKAEYDMLISNPPYIPTAEIEGLMEEVKLHDPRIALDGMEDGLYFYRKITEAAPDYLRSGGWLMYEIGCEQGPAVSEMMKNAGFTSVTVIQDLAGLDRVVAGQRL